MIWRRFDSLFMRLFVLQLALVMGVTLVFGALFYLERNRSFAVLQAEVWAPQLRDAIPSLAPAHPSRTQPVPAPLPRRDSPPDDAMEVMLRAPRIVALRSALAVRGVPVQDVAFTRSGDGVMTWLRIEAPGTPAAWYGLSGRFIEPRWPVRALLALLLTGSLLAWASWAFTRRLTRPLEKLRNQMREGTAATAGPPSTQAPPEIAEIEMAHAELLQNLQRQERERGLLLAGVSHDLRSPLARIRMAVELMPQNDDTASKRATIVRNVQAADRLIDSFVDFVRSGELPLNEDVDLVPLVRKVVAACERPAAELSMQLPASAVVPAANGLLIERLVTNLVDNAFKHGRAPVAVRVSAAPGRVLLEVQDAGPGIPLAAQDAMQQAFARGDASRGVAGTGLGLAIARQVVTRLGGTIGFDGQPGGHVVRVGLPSRG
jgi:two-component system osmolarity sensor histidine kinase EnvZ